MLRASVTIKDVAHAARVHYSTVSLALRDAPVVAAETRQRVQEAAERLGYAPNSVFSALSRYRPQREVARRRPQIAYVTNCADQADMRRHPHHRHYLEGALRQATRLGYGMKVLHVSETEHDSESLASYLKRHDIECLVLAAFEPGFSTLALDWDAFCVVKIDSRHIPPSVGGVSIDQLEVVRTAHREMTALGYRRIGLAVRRAEEESTDHRFTMGYFIEQAALAPGSRVPPLLFPHNCPDDEMGRLLCRWARKQKIDAVLTPWAPAGEHLRRDGLRVPDVVALALLSLTKPDPELAGVRISPGVVGAKVVSHVATLLRTGQRGISAFPTHTYVAGLWQNGASAPGR
ncbi:hypothetical protein DB347_00165 [Opitutaceae bacterium EW11]|nr:hypothetical protein DB347_00165 [Opitutaceae bacterium EW11]